jgi:hypothetical protein
MTLANELRALDPPGAAPDLTRGIMARIERLETTDPAMRMTDAAPPAWHAWMTTLALAAVALGVVLVVAGIGPWAGVINSGRALAVAIPAGPMFSLGPIALVSGLLLYVSGLWLSVTTRFRET